MLRRSALVCAVVAAAPVIFASCAKKDAKAAATDGGGTARAVLVVAADMRGYLGPCGCSENMRGGIARAAHQVNEARRSGAPVLFLEGGDSLFGASRLGEAQVAQEERKARALAEALTQMGLQLRARGELDDARGEAFRTSLRLPELPPGAARVLDAGGQRIGVAAGATEEELVAAAKKAREGGAGFVLGLYHRSLGEAQRLASSPELGVNLLLATHSEGELGAEENVLSHSAGVPVAQVQNKGRSLLRVDLSFEGGAQPFEPLRSQQEFEKEARALEERTKILNAQVNEPGIDPELKKLKQQKVEELVARRASLVSAPPPSTAGKNAFSVRFIPLEASLPSDPAAAALVEAYDRDVSRLNLEWAKQHGKDCPPPTPEEPGFVGNASCRECHGESFPVWEKSKHSHAFATLVERGKQYHLDCVRCHVTGMDQPGGVCRVDKMAGREDVGCESCHGPGSTHVEDPTVENILRRPAEAQCVGCHNPENSPHFDFARYLPQILGPGHGAPR
jgi:hypothetical protein